MSFKKWSKNVQKSYKIKPFGDPVLGLLLGGGPESSFFASWLSKNCLGTFFFASWSILGNFWGPNMASTSTLKWLYNRHFVEMASGRRPGGLREPFWSDFGSILAAPGASPAWFFEHVSKHLLAAFSVWFWGCFVGSASNCFALLRFAKPKLKPSSSKARAKLSEAKTKLAQS